MSLPHHTQASERATARAAGGLLLALLLLLAGCAGSSTSQGLGAPRASVDGAAVLRGLVVSDEVFPVRGASVAIDAGPSTTTDESGRFELVDVMPGLQVLTVTADGYEPLAYDVDVRREQVSEVVLSLVGLPGRVPHAATYVFSGIIACGWSIVFGAGWYPFTPCPSGQNQNVFAVEVGPDWRAGIHEMTWKSQDEMLFYSSMVPTCANRGGGDVDPCAAILKGPDALKIVARPEDAEYASKYAVDGMVTWPAGNYTSYLLGEYGGLERSRINSTFYPGCAAVNTAVGSPPEWGCPSGLGVTFGARFDFYHTTFYLEEPPNLEAFSALPDE